MKKRLIILGIHLAVVALVLILTMVTLAWYTKNDSANTSSAVITAESQDNIGIEEIPSSNTHYSGQTGLGGEDAPYIANKILLITQESKHTDDAVTCSLKSISVKLANGNEINGSTEGFSDILDAFTFRVIIVEIDENNQITNRKGVFYPSESGILVDEDKNELYFQNENFFIVEENALSNSKTCSTHILIELIFLDEESYSNYPPADENVEITPFRFSSYNYMGSTFYATFALGKEEESLIQTNT